MVQKLTHTWLFYLLTLLLVTACSGGGDSAVDLSAGGNITQGIAVDPYITGAVFQETDGDTGTVLQESLPSDDFGRFSFAEPLTPGSVVELVPGTGLHGGAPYQGMLRRLVVAGDDSPLVVSPLTTLLAIGFQPEELIAAFNDAGLTGLSNTDLYADPMEGLADKTAGVVYQNLDLKPLQASMAANAYLEIIEGAQAGMNELNDADHAEIFSSMLKAMADLLNEETFIEITDVLASDPDVTASPILEDYILAVVAQQQTIVSLVQKDMDANGVFNLDIVELAVQDAMGKGVAMVKASYGQRVPLAEAYDGATLYHENCSACHGILANTEKPGSTAADIQTAIDHNYGGMGQLNTLTPGEIAAIAEVLPPAQGPASAPAAPVDGITLYSADCAGCHGQLAATSKPGRSAAEIQGAINSNRGGMGFLSALTPDEVQAIADVLPSAPVVDPTQPADGTTLYSNNCAGCHGQLAATSKPGRNAGDIQAAINDDLGGMGFLSSLTPDEVQAIADVLPPAPVVDPTQPADGTALYSNNCAGCHGQLAVSAKPGRSAADIQGAIDSNLGGMGFLSSLTPDEVQAIADVLPQSSGPVSGPDYSDCTLCHGQPPSGNSFPDTAGAHAVHTSLASVGGDCSICHLGAGHNSQVDLGFPAAFDAKSGPATDNLDGTCSSVKCHGGQTTPDWWSGSIAVDTECTSCHSSGTSQYNSYSSGRHSKHVNGEGFSCTVCHNTTVLGSGHFNNLETSGFELNPADTIGGGSTRVGSYSNGTCSNIACHGSERW